MKNILFSDSCRANCWGGVEKWVVMMAKQLALQGYQPHLVCRPHSLLAYAAQDSNIAIHQANFKNCLDIRTISKIHSIINNEDIDIVVCATNLDIKLAGIAGKIASIPVISRQGLALIPNNLKYKYIIKYLTTSIITNTQSIKQQYELYGWFPAEHIHVIYNGVIPFPNEPVKDLRSQLLSTSDEKLILSAGRLSPQKGFAYLIEAALIAQTQGKHWKFIILGDGQEKNSLQKLITQKRIKNVQLLGFQNNMHDFYRNADIFVLSSLAEGTPNVVLEAMVAHCPVIATNVNGICEVIKNNENGWTIPIQNSQAIFETIEKHINQTEVLQKITDNAYQTVIDKFTIEESSQKFIKYINNTIKKYEKNHHKNS